MCLDIVTINRFSRLICHSSPSPLSVLRASIFTTVYCTLLIFFKDIIGGPRVTLSPRPFCRSHLPVPLWLQTSAVVARNGDRNNPDKNRFFHLPINLWVQKLTLPILMKDNNSENSLETRSFHLPFLSRMRGEPVNLVRGRCRHIPFIENNAKIFLELK